jgi:hypothetical protein
MRTEQIAAILREIEREPVQMRIWLANYDAWPHQTSLALLLAAEKLENMQSEELGEGFKPSPMQGVLFEEKDHGKKSRP